MPKALIIGFYLSGVPFPALYFFAMILAQTKHWDLSKIPQEGGAEQDHNVAVVVNANNQVPIMNPNDGFNQQQIFMDPRAGGQQNNLYEQHNMMNQPINVEPPPQMIIMQPQPIVPDNGGVNLGAMPVYTASGPASTQNKLNDDFTVGQPV